MNDGEECDDKNDNNNDECLSTCKNATCGDGFTGPDEDCDDQNSIEEDACVNCITATCGDGYVWNLGEGKE